MNTHTGTTGEQPRESVLLLTDDARGDATLREALAPCCGLLSCGTLEQALALLASPTPPDLVLLDLRSGAPDVPEALRRLRAAPGGQELPILFLCGPGGSADIEACLTAGATDCIDRSAPPTLLRARLRGQFDLRRARAQLHDADARDAERQAAEAQLRKLSLAVEQSPESIVITNLDARIEYVNESFVRNTGYSREEAIGQNPRMLHSGKTPTETFQSLWKAMRAGEAWKGEFYNRRKDGSEYVEFAIVTPIRQPDGSVTHYVAVKEDITEKKRLGRELDQHRHHLQELVAQRTAELTVAQQRAEAANRAKSAFLANMSHEIRTPMSAIIGLAHLLRRDGATPEQIARLEKIDGAGRHLLSILNNILDLSKIDAGRLQLELADFELSAILDDVLAMTGDAAREKGLEVRLDLDAIPGVLRGDPTRLRQALLNYVGNAIKFTEQGCVLLRTRLLENLDGELLVRFEVEDTGIGIAEDHLPRLFQAFEQADSATTRNYGGTGLGLAITRRLARLMGGETGVESRPGRGSTFWFSARFTAQERSGEAGTGAGGSAANPAPLRSGARILLAEDNWINQEVAVDLLARTGLTVDIANDGLEAFEKARLGGYHLILMDMQMPRMDGPEATRAIRAIPGLSGLPIVAMTANAFEEDRERCRAAGMSDFIAKPIEPQVLFDTLRRWLPAPEGAELTEVPQGAPAELAPSG